MTKKRLLIALAVLLTPILALVIAMIIAFSGMGHIVDGQELGGLARVVADGYVSVTFLDVGGGKIALIDAGNDPTGAAILAELKRRGLGSDAVSAIFLTHGHRDHVGAASLFPKADIYALTNEVAIAEGREKPRGPLPGLFPLKPQAFKVNHPLNDGDHVQVGSETVEVFALPGHTRGSAAYLVHGLLFFGDSADASSDGKLCSTKWLFSDDVGQNEAALRALEKKLEPRAGEIKTLVFAHSGTLSGFEPLKGFGAST